MSYGSAAITSRPASQLTLRAIRGVLLLLLAAATAVMSGWVDPFPVRVRPNCRRHVTDGVRAGGSKAQVVGTGHWPV